MRSITAYYSSGAIRAAVKLSAKHINDRRLPDKAIDVIDEIGAAVKIQPEEKRRKMIGPKDIEKIVAKIAKIPPRSVSSLGQRAVAKFGPRSEARRFRSRLRHRHAGEHDQTFALGLGHPEKPIGCFLFAGPTGVGKTELAKQLAKTMGIEFLALRHERIHGKAHGIAPDRRAAGLCRLRPGRFADRRDQSQSLCGAAAR
jgi:ATP-dependent Clp protease ATP-binding subunit ClpA